MSSPSQARLSQFVRRVSFLQIVQEEQLRITRQYAIPVRNSHHACLQSRLYQTLFAYIHLVHEKQKNVPKWGYITSVHKHTHGPVIILEKKVYQWQPSHVLVLMMSFCVRRWTAPRVHPGRLVWRTHGYCRRVFWRTGG